MPVERLTMAQRRALLTRLRELGRQRGLTTDGDLAAAAGLTAKSIKAMEDGVQGPTLSTLLAFCKGLRVYSVDQLLGPSSSLFFANLDAIEGGLGGMAEVLQRQVAEPSIGSAQPASP